MAIDPLLYHAVTDVVATAISLAKSQVDADSILDTHMLLTALEASDVSPEWARFIISSAPHDDCETEGSVQADDIRISSTLRRALTRADRIADAFDLVPIPAGVIALALVWEPTSEAAASVVGTDHHKLIADIQNELLDVELDGVEELLTDPDGTTGSPLGEESTHDRHDSWSPGRRAAAGSQEADETEPDLSGLMRTVPMASAWLFRLLAAAAIFGAILAVTTSDAWQFTPIDDLDPPFTPPPAADAIPTTSAMSSVLGTELVLTQDGPPDMRIYNSTMPIAYDIRTQFIEGAWSRGWLSTDGRTSGLIQVARLRADSEAAGDYVRTCNPTISEGVESSTTSLAAGSDTRTNAGFNSYSAGDHGDYCTSTFVKRTQVVVGVSTHDPKVLKNLPANVAQLREHISETLPEPAGKAVTSVPTPYARATINKFLLIMPAGLALLWLLPTLLFDRGTWQRIRWTLTLQRLRGMPLPGIDVDPLVRRRLWSSVALASVEVCAATWVLRWTVGWTIVPAALAVVASALFIGALPRLRYLRRVRTVRTFAGRRWWAWLLAFIIGLSVIALAAGLAFLASTALSIGAGGGSPDYVQRRLGILVGLLSIPVALLALLPMTLVRRLAMRAFRKHELPDDRAPVLLLRSFADDKRRLRTRSNHRRALLDRLSLRRWERFEEVIAASLADEGPVLGVGQVGERLPPALGAVRRQFTNEEWQDRVYELMERSSLICVTLGRSDALAWEISRIARAGLLHKTILVLPPTSRREHIRRLTVLASLLNLNWADLDVSLTGSWALAVHVPNLGAQPTVVRARAQEDVGYDIALEIARLAAQGADFKLPSLADDFPRSRPNAHIYPPGETPAYKPRRKLLIAFILFGSTAVTLPFTFLAGQSLDASVAITLDSGYEWTAIAANRTGPGSYGVINGSGLVKLNFDDQSGDLLATIEPANQLAANGGTVFSANNVTGTVQATDVSTGTIRWSLEDLQGMRGMTAGPNLLYFALPSRHEIEAVSVENGSTVARQHVSGIPWGTALGRNGIYVSLIDASATVRLDRQSLEITRRISTDPGPRELAVADNSLWEYSVSTHRARAILGPQKGLWITTLNQFPNLSGNGRTLAFEGVETIATIDNVGTLTNSRLFTREAYQIAVTSSGNVLSMYGKSVTLLRPSKG